MKKQFIYILLVTFFISCSKDDDTPDLVTPSLTWKASNIIDNYLEISITINSTDNLPSGKIEFIVDNNTIDTFTAEKGTKTYKTKYSFSDTEEHFTNLVYSFSDGRSSINKAIKIKKIFNENLEKSTKDDWMDF